MRDLTEVPATGFGDVPVEVLEILHGNLLSGLDKIAASVENGTFHEVGHKGKASPAQAGQLTLSLLVGIELELQRRGR